jgi:PIN domain nuclease of toxin-antitoxin system
MDAAVCDAHALIWAASGHPKRLGRRARRFLEEVDDGKRRLIIPSIALVEIGEAVHRARVRFPGRTFTEWMAELSASPVHEIAPLTAAVVIAADQLHAIQERGDRLIAATALTLGLPLITRDPAIAEVAAVPLIW